jgi:hypothetical protein
VRGLRLLLLAGFAVFSPAAQQPTLPSPPQTSKNEAQVVHTNDGGVNETMQSIVVPPKAGAPFTLTLETEWVKTLSDGGTITYVNKRQIARDTAGRIYQERWELVPKNDASMKSEMNVIQIMDPSAHTLYNCFLIVKAKTCELLTYAATTSTIYKPSSLAPGPLPNDQGWIAHQNLGKQLIDGVETEGTHDSITYNPGVFGNDRRMTVENEFWYSPQLGINLLSIRTDPRIGKQTFTVTSVIQAEPDSALFELPAGFKVVDRQKTATSQPSSSSPSP